MSLSNLTPEGRLEWWRNIRHRDHATIADVVAEFGDLEPQLRYLDYYTPSSWPSPFEIVAEGQLDVSGISLTLAATLCYKKLINSERLHFDVISSHVDGAVGLFLRHESEYINFIPGQVNTVQFVQDNGTIFDSHSITYQQLMKQE
jgi:hypothetical protein